MSKIYSSLSNPSGDLGQLQNEFKDLFNFFNNKEVKKKVDFEFGINATIDELTSTIIAGQKEIRMFHFSGHSGKSGLDFPVADFTTERISKFFNTICSDQSKIQCVFLNGCENEEIVNQLLDVPVVIGTRSKIQDTVARKFTQDYFSALIKSESTYRQAFMDAAAAQNNLPITILDKTRSEGGRHNLSASETLNDYFLVINDPTVAQGKFPFKKGKTNWTKYIFLIFLVVALVLGFLFRGKIFGEVKGYSCELIHPLDPNKCNFVIGDIVSIPKIEKFNDWLYLGVKFDTILKNYLNPINIEQFANVIFNKKIDPKRLPDLCNYDFNLTGTITEAKTQFNIFPFDKQSLLDSTFTYFVNSIASPDTLFALVKGNKSNQFVLFEMCIRCALEKEMPAIPIILKKMAESIDSTHGTVAYQRLYLRMTDLNLHDSDTISAIQSLDNVIGAVGNDIALMATERKIDLYTSSNDIISVFDTQSDLVAEYQARVEQPNRFMLKGDAAGYKQGENTVRLNRAMLIYQYRDNKLQNYKKIALQDFEYLQSINFPPGDFSKEIADLKGTPVEPVTKFHVHGRVMTGKEEPLKGALLTFGRKTITTDADGYFDFGSYSTTYVLDKVMLISHLGYKDKTIKLTGAPIGTIILNPKEGPIRVNLQAVQTQEDQYQKILSYLKSTGFQINSGYSKNSTSYPPDFAKVSSVVYYRKADKDKATSLANQLIIWTGGNYEVHASSIPPATTSAPAGRDDITIQIVGTNKPNQPDNTPTKLHLQGNVFTESGQPLDKAVVVFNDQRKITDEKGMFDYGTFNQSEVYGKALFVSHDGFQNITIKISEENISKIILKRTAPVEIPPKYTLYMQGVKVNPGLFRKILSSLKSKEYPINSSLSDNLESRPEYFEKVSTVVYYHEGNKERANSIAKQMGEWTNEKFDVKLLSYPKSITSTRIKEEDIFIEWIGAN